MDQVVARSANATQPANPLLSAPILPTLLRLTAPNLAAMLVTALVAIFETVYVGILGTTQLAAIALVFPLIMLMQMLSAGAMGGGVSSAISRALGAGDASARRGPCRCTPRHRRRGGPCLHAALRGVRRARSCARSAAAVRCSSEALVYASMGLTGAIVIWLLNTLASIVRGTGNMRVPSLTLLAASALQIVLGGALGPRPRTVPALRARRRRLRLRRRLRARGALFLLWFLRSGRGAHNAHVRRCRSTARDVLRHPEGRRGGGVLAAAIGADGADPDAAGGQLRHRGAGRLRHRRPPRVPAGADRIRRRASPACRWWAWRSAPRHRARTAGGVDRRRRRRRYAGGDRARRDDCARPVVGTVHERSPPSAPRPTCTCAGPGRGSPSSGSGLRSTSPRRAPARCWDRCWPPPFASS